MLSHLNNNEPHTPTPKTIRILYTSRLPQGDEIPPANKALDQVLFLPRLRQMIRSQETSHRLRISLDLFLTNIAPSSDLLSSGSPSDIAIHPSRISDDDLRSAVGSDKNGLSPRETVCYVCGPPAMTDSIVERLDGMLGEGADKRIFFEKWW
jgi:hypothetical protein